jgi:hypothetical protein
MNNLLSAEIILSEDGSPPALLPVEELLNLVQSLTNWDPPPGVVVSEVPSPTAEEQEQWREEEVEWDRLLRGEIQRLPEWLLDRHDRRLAS